MIRNTFFLSLFILFLASCSSENRSDDRTFEYPPTVELREVDAWYGAGNQLFARPDLVLPLKSDAFIIGDSQALNLFLFDRNGEHRHTFGGSGEGPGEFQRFSDISINESGVTVYDNRRATISEIEVVDGTLSLLATGDLMTTSHPDHPGAMFWGFMEGSNGDQMALYYDFNILSREPLAYHRIVAYPYADYKPAAEDPVRVFDYSPELRYENGVLGVPYLKRGLFTSADGTMAYALNNEPAVQIYNRKGELIRTIKLPDTSVEFTRSQKMEAYDRMYENSPDPERFRSEVLAHIPDRRPIIRSLQSDADERIWVRIYREGAAPDWLVFDREGKPLMQLALPEGHTFRNARGNRLFTQRTTDDGPEIVMSEIMGE